MTDPPRPELCPHATHVAPDPVDGRPTSCPCGLVRKFPPPPPKEPHP